VLVKLKASGKSWQDKDNLMAIAGMLGLYGICIVCVLLQAI
jgi:hypothetical protein